jgi:hypothetical protein
MTKTYSCSWCANQFESNWPADSPRYCSSKCRQAAYRDNKRKTPRGYRPDVSPSDKAIETKQADVRLQECENCGMWYEVSGLQRTRQRYCSNKCRVASYRSRVAYKARCEDAYQKSVNAPKDPEKEANRALRRVFMDVLRDQQLDEFNEWHS